MKRFIFFALFILCVIDGFSANKMLQNEEFKQQTVRGIVKDLITKRPIPYANVYLPDGTAGTVTNEEGLFTIKVKSSSDSITVAENYPQSDNLLNLFYRETIKKGSRYVGISEGILDLQEQPRADVQRNLPARERPFEKSQIFDDTAEQNWDRDFWREYNIIEPTESLERAVEKLKRIYFAK